MQNIELLISGNVDKEKIEKINQRINLIEDNKMISENKLVLKLDTNGLSLINNETELREDFSKLLNRIKPNNLNSESIIKAAKFKEKKEDLVAIDATAGLGEDSLLLAAYGFKVELFEKNPIIALLLEDAIERAMEIPELVNIVSRMKVHFGDSIIEMPKLKINPDVILLDPMFPERKKKSLIKKKFQILHLLEEPCNNEKELLDSAILLKPKKIIIKRPINADKLGDIKPSYSIKGDTIRYDCIYINNDIR